MRVRIKPRYLKWTVYSLFLLLVSVLQTTPGLLPALWEIRPVLLSSAVVCIAMFESDVLAGAFGLVAGLLWDNASNRLLGLNALLLFAACITVSLLLTYLMRNNVYTALLLCACVIFIVEICDWFFYYVLLGYDHSLYVLARFYLPTMLYSLVLSPLLYWAVKAIVGFLRKSL